MKLQKHVLFLLVACVTSFAAANSIDLSPDPADLDGLNHDYYYTWGIHYTQIDPGADLSDIVITGASLFFDDIHNYNNSDNDLWVYLLDKKPLGADIPNGVKSIKDWGGWGDAFFFWQGTMLEHYINLSDDPQDITHDFTGEQVQKLNEYLQNNGNFALGFDPDCHFWNNGITLTLDYYVTPEPACCTLLGTGAVFLLLRRRRK